MKVHFVVLPGVYLLDLAGIADALRVANRLAGKVVFDCEYVGIESSAATSIGLPLDGLQPLPDSLAPGAIVVLPGMSPNDRLDARAATVAVRWLVGHFDARHRLACICNGAFLAGRAGLLDGRSCTTHHEDCDRLQRDFPEAIVRNNRIFVVDGNVLTSAGVTAGIDLALHLIAEHAGPVVASGVARALVVYLRRTGTDVQLSPWLAHRNHLHPVVHRAQDAIVAAPTNDWTLAAIAAVSHASVRHLTRLFRDETGVTPLEYLQHVRLGIARERLATTDLSIDRVAEQSGFHSAHQLRRIWRRYEERTPSAARTRVS